MLFLSETSPSGQNHVESAGNPQGWRILGGGESARKFGLCETRVYVEIEGGTCCMDSSGISRRFPAEFIGIFGGFIGEKNSGGF